MLADEERETVYVLERYARTFCHAEQRVVGHMELYADFVDETFVEAAQKSTAAGEVYAVFNNVGI